MYHRRPQDGRKKAYQEKDEVEVEIGLYFPLGPKPQEKVGETQQTTGCRKKLPDVNYITNDTAYK